MYIIFFFNLVLTISIIASPKVRIPPFKSLVPASGSDVADGKVDLLERDIQALESRLANTERFLKRLVTGVMDKAIEDKNSVPDWLIGLLQPVVQPVVPRVHEPSGHTIGRVVYSPKTQQPKKIISSHFIKMEEDMDEGM